MADTTRFQALIQTGGRLRLNDPDWAVLDAAITAWAKRTTDPASPRVDDLLRDKQRVVYAFFRWVQKRPQQVTSADVAAWQDDLRLERDPDTGRRRFAPATVYAMVSRVSSFYQWAQKNAKRADVSLANPVDAVRPKAPKPFQGKSTKALTDDELQVLVATVQEKAEGGSIVGLRDYAMLLFYVLTGFRREEVAGLQWGDLTFERKTLLVSVRVKGGDRVTRELSDDEARSALLAYLRASGRKPKLKRTSPLWTRHDRAGRPGPALTSHAFAKNMKGYAVEAGLEHFHLHQTRHTFARIVAEDTGSLLATQDALGHANPQTTKVYVQRVGIKRDLHSGRVTARLKQPRP